MPDAVDHLPDQRAPAPIPDAAIPAAHLLEWRPRTYSAGGRLAGHCTVVFSGGWIVSKIPVFRSPAGDLSIGVPSIPGTRPDGTRTYLPVISFANAAARGRWERTVLAALEAGIAP